MLYYKGKDEWFDQNWSEKITPQFATWWLSYYGHPDRFDPGEHSEYFVRMAFAFMGWQAARELPA